MAQIAKMVCVLSLVCCVSLFVVAITTCLLPRDPKPIAGIQGVHKATSDNVKPVLTSERETPLMMGYIVADAYGDQLSRAVRNYYQLADIAAHWNMKIVEPHMDSKKSGLIGVPNSNQYFGYGDLYNITAVHRELDKCLELDGYKLVSSLEEFLWNCKREFVSLSFLRGREIVSKNKPSVSDCTSSFSFSVLEDKLNHYLENDAELRQKAVDLHGQQYRFKGVHAVCVNQEYFSIHNVTSYLVAIAKRLSQSEEGILPALTVVLPEWRAIFRETIGQYYYHDPGFSWNMSDTCNSNIIPHGQKVLDAAETFSNSLKLPRPVLGIHIRIEKIAAIDQSMKKGFWQGYVHNLELAIQSLQLKHNLTTHNMFAMHDVGKYGSGTLRGCALCDRIKTEVLSILDRRGVHVVYYEPTNFGQPKDKGIVSLVEKELLSRSDYLLTVGGGSFQTSLIARFLEKHSKSNLHILFQMKS